MTNTLPPNVWLPRTLVVGPGGMRGHAYLGALQVLQREGRLLRVDTYCGVSVGAIICLLLCCGYTADQLIEIAGSFDFLAGQPPLELNGLLHKQGLFTNETIQHKLTALLVAKLGQVPTLSSLRSLTGKTFVTVTSNVTTDKRTILSPVDHGSLSVVDAVLRSINIPFAFAQLVEEHTIFADGALTSPYPVDYFDDGNTQVLGLYARSKYYNVNHPLPLGIHLNKVVDLLVDATYYYQQRACSNRCRHICVSIPVDASCVSLNIYRDIPAMLEAGRKEAEQFVADNLRWFGQSEHHVYSPYRLEL